MNFFTGISEGFQRVARLLIDGSANTYAKLYDINGKEITQRSNSVTSETRRINEDKSDSKSTKGCTC